MPASAPVNAETVPTANSTMTSQLHTGSLEPSRNMSRARCARKDALLLWVGAVHPSVAPHGRRPPLHQDAPSSTTPTVSRSHPARRHRPKGSRNTSIPNSLCQCGLYWGWMYGLMTSNCAPPRTAFTTTP